MNRRVDIREDIKRYQETLSYASSKVNYSVGESIYMIPSNMNLKIRSGTAGYNNKILVSDGNFILGKNEKVNSLEVRRAPQAETPAIKNHKTNSLETPTSKVIQISLRGLTHAPTNSHHEDEKIALILFIAGGFTVLGPVSMKVPHLTSGLWNIFQ